MKLFRGQTPENAIEISVTFLADVSQKVHLKLDELFGGKDAEYYVMGERFIDSKTEIYAVLVEDKSGKKHQIFFKISMVK